MPRRRIGLVPALGRHLLAEHVDEMAAELVALIVATVPEYADADREDLRHSCRRNMVRSLQALAGDLPRPEDLLDAPAHTGRLRAQQGLPLDALLQSYRLGGRVLWEGLLLQARSRHAEVDPARLLDVATVVWELVDEHSSEVTRAYRAEESRLRGRDLRRQHVLLDALLDGQGADPATVAEAEGLLDLRRDGRFLVVVTATPGSSDELGMPQEALARLGSASWWRVRAGGETGLVELPEAGPRAALDALRACAVGRAAASPVVAGTAELPSAARLAELALATLAPDHVGLVEVGERLPEALLVGTPGLADLLVREALGPVLDLPVQEREALLRTLEEMVRSGGSLSRAAVALYCHRNTVLNRMQRVERLTGRTLGNPRDHLVLSLALLAARLPDRAERPGG